ncbi:MAG: L,D-transpeptidase family protein, partial [Pirellulaceae bacterium]
LDLLAGKVIYSTEHHLQTRPYVVSGSDTLESLAAQWQVPAQLIYNVNSSKIGDPANLVPGTELKVIQGPFNAVVNIDRQELTLFLSGMYAGRFPVDLGEDGGGVEHGQFVVQQKQSGKEYTDPAGQTIAAGAGNNPYGRFWIELNENLGIHESNPQNGPGDRRGSIRLGSRDAQDVFGILSHGSQVTITR